jgi:hypothetical protein
MKNISNNDNSNLVEIQLIFTMSVYIASEATPSNAFQGTQKCTNNQLTRL